jgi:hypothetical protein
MSEDDRTMYKIYSIGCAMFSAFLGSIRIQ